MPTYEYACTSCGHRFETVQSFSDAALTACPACGGPLRKVFGNVGIVLKGSGFYKTDSRSSSRHTGPAKESKETESTTTSSDKAKDAAPAKDAKPAKEPSSSGSSSTSSPAAAATPST